MLMLLSASTVFAGAVSAVPVSKVICYANGNCGDLQQLIRQCQSGNCNLKDWLCAPGNCDRNGSQYNYGNYRLSELLKTIGGYCPDGNCSTVTPPAEQTESIEPVVPVTSTEPDVSATPTEPDVSATPTEPEQSAAEPTESQVSEFRTAYENEVISLVNSERAKVGLPALSADSGAVDAAHIRAKEIVQSFSHTRPDGRSCFTAASDLGVSYRTAGENIAYGYATPQQVVSGWMNSEGHRKNILSSSFTKIGVGCYESSGVLYWSQFFIG